MVLLPPNAPSTALQCMGTTSTAAVPIGVGAQNVAGGSYFPSSFTQLISGDRLQTMELFFFVNSPNQISTLFQATTTNGAANTSIVYIGSINFMQVRFNDSLGVTRTITFSTNLSAGRWYHMVIRLEGSQWFARVGYTGENTDATTGTPDTYPYASATGGTAGSTPGLAGSGIRVFGSTPSETRNIGVMGTAAGTSYLPGGMAEMRLWKTVRSNAQITQNRALFVEYDPADDNQHLVHCWRFNENAQAPADIKDAGLNCSTILSSWNVIRDVTLMDFPDYPFQAGGPFEFFATESVEQEAELTATYSIQKPLESITATPELTLTATVERIKSASVTALQNIPAPQFLTDELASTSVLAPADLSATATKEALANESVAPAAELVLDYDLDQVIQRNASVTADPDLALTYGQTLSLSASVELDHTAVLNVTKDAIKSASLTGTGELVLAAPAQILSKSATLIADAVFDLQYQVAENITASLTAAPELAVDFNQVLSKSASVEGVPEIVLNRDSATQVVANPELVLTYTREASFTESLEVVAELTATPSANKAQAQALEVAQDLSLTAVVDRGLAETVEQAAEFALSYGQVLSKSASVEGTAELVASPAQVYSVSVEQAAELTLSAVLMQNGGNEDSFAETVPTIGGGGPSFWWRLDDALNPIADEVGSSTGIASEGFQVKQDSLLVGEPGNKSMGFPLAPSPILSPYVQGVDDTVGRPILGQPYSFIGFFNLDPAGAGTSNRHIINRLNAFRLFVLADGRLRFQTFADASGSTTIDTAAGTIVEGTTYFFCCTWSPTNGMRLYVDAVLEDSSPSTTADRAVEENETFYVSRFRDTVSLNLPTRGRVDEVAWWESYELTQEDVTSLYEGAPNAPGIDIAATVEVEPELTLDYQLCANRTASITATPELDLIGLPVRDAGEVVGVPEITLGLTFCFAANCDEETGAYADFIREEDALEVKTIWNQALTLLGARRVESISDAGREADILRAVWDEFRVGFLADHSWNGAETEVKLDRFTDSDTVTEVKPANTDRWAYAYALPTDNLRILKVNGAAATTSRDKYKVTTLSNDTGKKRVLLSNEGTVYVEYVYDIGDSVGLLSPKTRRAMAAMLAAHIAPYFGKDPATVQALEGEADREMRAARGVDGQEGFPQLFNDSSLLGSRRRR